MNIRPFVSTSVFVLALSASAAIARVHVDGDHCDVKSGYSTRVEADRIAFTNDKSRQVLTLLPGGEVLVDGKPLPLDAADRARFVALERSLRKLVPEAKALAVDAVAIAFEAVGHVSTAFASSPHEARQSAVRIARTADEIKRSINVRDNWGPDSDREIGELIEGAVGSLIGEMVGNITAQAVTVALSGDESAVAELEARAGSIEKNVEKAVEKRAVELEERAEALCQRVHEMDRIESQISARLPDGSAFDLVQVRR